QDGSLNITTSDPSTPIVRAALTGVGTVATAPAIQVNPTSLSFGSVSIGQTRAMTVNLSNSGNAALTVSAFVVSDPQFAVLSPSTPFTLQPNGQQLVSVRYAPTASGNVTATLSILSNDPNRGTLTVGLSGTGVTQGPTQPPKISTLVPA